MFHAPWFILAGLALAAGPLLIHLLNRQRYRVVRWAAMDFLRQAVRRSRRILRLRDLVLLALRTLCVLLFALAMARPHFRASSNPADPDQPVHAVLVVDNSLSMGYQRLDGTLLDEAKAKAADFIERLPPGSRISVLPLCGSATEFSRGASGAKEDAVEALEAIETVDRAASAAAAVDLALEACRQVSSPPAKQVVFLSDQQSANWPAESLLPQLQQLADPMQVVQVAEPKTENAWVADFKLQDGVADRGTPAVFLATVRYQGRFPRHDVQVTLTVDGVSVASQTVALQPGQSREVRFPPYRLDAALDRDRFDVAAKPDRATFVTAEVSIPHDRLPDDDQRFLVVPVVAALPVVFVDQVGADEDPGRNRFGETYRLRRLLAPRAAGEEPRQQPVEVRQVKPGRLDRNLLADARLVVMAGIADPAAAVPVLREYVEQGGNLVIAAGGDFDPAAWTDAAWLDGLGILPAPLKPEPVGRLPSLAPEPTAGSGDPRRAPGAGSGDPRRAPRRAPIEPFQLDFASLVHPDFLLEQTSREELEDLYRLPYFFKAVEADLSDGALQGMARAVTRKIENDRRRVAEIEGQLAALAQLQRRQTLSETDRNRREQLEQARADAEPDWLLWDAPPPPQDEDSSTARELAEQTRPRVLAAFTNRVPFMIQRSIGRGQVLFVSTGVWRDWNTLTTTNTVLIFDRIFRRLLQRTLPQRAITTSEQIAIPVEGSLRHARFTLTGPAEKEETVTVDALGADRYGIVVDNLPARGHYRLTAYGTEATPQVGLDSRLWEIPLAVNGPARESELETLDARALQVRMGPADFRWIDREEPISLTGGRIGGQELWRWLMLALLVALLVEMAILAWSSLANRQGEKKETGVVSRHAPRPASGRPPALQELSRSPFAGREGIP